MVTGMAVNIWCTQGQPMTKFLQLGGRIKKDCNINTWSQQIKISHLINASICDKLLSKQTSNYFTALVEVEKTLFYSATLLKYLVN